MDYINRGITRLIQPTQKAARLISGVLAGQHRDYGSSNNKQYGWRLHDHTRSIPSK